MNIKIENFFDEIYIITFREIENSLTCVKKLFIFIYIPLILLTSTAYVSMNAKKYGMPLSRYTVFLKTVL